MAMFRQLSIPAIIRNLYSRLKRVTIALGAVLLTSLVAGASQLEDSAADAASAAFDQGRQAAHLSRLGRIDGNTFREKVCEHKCECPQGLSMTCNIKRPIPDGYPTPHYAWRHREMVPRFACVRLVRICPAKPPALS